MGNPLSVIRRQQTYINALYALLAFPLGLAYFVFLVTGLSVGFGLLVIWVGVPILALVLAGSWALSRFEQELTNRMLKLDIPGIPLPKAAEPLSTSESGLSTAEGMFIRTWRQFKAHLSDRLTWTGMLYLFLKFPIGVASFVIVVTLASVTGAMLSAPFFYDGGDWIPIEAWDVDWIGDGISIGIWQVDRLWEALVLMVAGVPFLFISLHLINATAWVSGQIARVMLGKLR